MNGAVTDGMDWHDLGTTPAFRYSVMPFDLFTKGPLAEPASIDFLGGYHSSLGLDQTRHPLHTSAHRLNMVYRGRKNSGIRALSDAA